MDKWLECRTMSTFINLKYVMEITKKEEKIYFYFNQENQNTHDETNCEVVRFLDDDTLLVNNYSRYSTSFTNKLYGAIGSNLKANFYAHRLLVFSYHYIKRHPLSFFVFI